MTNGYLFLGYEHYLNTKFIIGASYGFLGNTRYKNKIFSNSEGRQFDTGTFMVLELYVDYKLSDLFAIYVNYGFRKDKLDIKTPSEIQNQFNKAQFNHFGVGIKLRFGQTDLINLF